MKKILCFVAVALTGVLVTFAQTVTLTFTGRDAANHYMQLNRVVITNQTKGWSETIYWPDTTLIMQNVTGIDESVANGGFALSQNNPNPFAGTTNVNLTVADASAVTLEIVDGNGRIVETWCTASLQMGTNQFRITLSAVGTYVLTARQNGKTSSIKMVCNGAGNGNRIEYIGTAVETCHGASLQLSPQPKSHTRGTTTNPFTFGDQMEYVGYATLNGEEVECQHIMQIQSASQTFVLLFSETPIADGQPCPGTPTLTDIDGNVYNTVWIGAQCWMKESLRTTKYSDGTPLDSFPATDSYHAYWMYANNNGSPWTKPTFGLLYNWMAVMYEAESSNSSPSGVQGICPDGWHVPSSAEWSHLTDYVSSQSQYICGDDNTNIAKALSDTAWWSSSTTPCSVGFEPNSNNATGFSARPAGYYASFTTFGRFSYFWSSTETNDDDAIRVELSDVSRSVYIQNRVPFSPKYYAYSVRCIRN